MEETLKQEKSSSRKQFEKLVHRYAQNDSIVNFTGNTEFLI